MEKIERDVMEVDVLFVGGGVASLSGALHLTNLIAKHNERVEQTGQGEKLEEISIAILEKGMDVSSHNMSGAVMDPTALAELVPDFEEKGAPLEGKVTKEDVLFLTPKMKFKAPITPPPLNNHGNYVVSLSALSGWLGGLVEETGLIDIFPGFAGTEILYEHGKVAGVRTGDKGIGPHGEQKANFEPGIDLKAKVTVFGEGTRGSLTKQLIAKLNLDEGKNPPSYVVGVKEVWELPEGRIQPGYVAHTMGFPLKANTYGGGFIYGMKDNRVSIGQLTGLDYADPALDPHQEFQRFKTHPFVAKLLEGGKMLQYGAKTAPVGGWYSVPRLAVDNGLIIGDAAMLFVSMKLKGIHAAMKSGMLAAETILGALKKNYFSAAELASYQRALEASYVGQALKSCRNFHQTFEAGLFLALPRAGAQWLMKGWDPLEPLKTRPDQEHMKTLKKYYGAAEPTAEQKRALKFDGKLTIDKLTDVYYSGATHEEHQPPHLKVLDMELCLGRCREEYGNPCTVFCPAQVYEMEENEETGKLELKLNFSNCLHCKTCDVKDPYGNISWVPPEGGGGPKYTIL